MLFSHLYHFFEINSIQILWLFQFSFFSFKKLWQVITVCINAMLTNQPASRLCSKANFQYKQTRAISVYDLIYFSRIGIYPTCNLNYKQFCACWSRKWQSNLRFKKLLWTHCYGCVVMTTLLQLLCYDHTLWYHIVTTLQSSWPACCAYLLFAYLPTKSLLENP